MLKKSLISCLVFLALAGSHPSSCAADRKDVDILVKRTLRDMVPIPGGTFEMGDFGSKIGEKRPLTGETDDQPLHKVTLSDFSFSKYKVTYRDYDIFTAATGKKKIDPGDTLLMSKHFRDPDMAAALDWYQSREYCQWLGKQANKKMDIPTEAQWEYVARNKGEYVVYATDNGEFIDGHNIPTSDQKRKYTNFGDLNIPIAKLPPTPLGIFDMAGNGTDWVMDWYSPEYYKNSPEKDPQGPADGNEKVIRGYQAGGGAFSNQTVFRQHALPDVNKGQDFLDPTMNARCVINE
ncbi:SUMF1/EgtB/PvdO family nonheme iron enzyme [Brenneria populi]|uniref:SUMF1/EgtB/PvdO family nonheme iron enzyme n=1 Tax=Brenneria populi TaxID=1505588 RepID=A0ABU6JX54_9GAMM|nr:SUMF1/EgtB/PvdO family nonheme iron enzyme [Brenneria populi Li et al. 2015]